MSNAEQLSGGLKWLARIMQALALLVAVLLVAAVVFAGAINGIIDSYWMQLAEEHRELVTYTDTKQALVWGIAAFAVLSPLLVIFGIWHVFGAFSRGPIWSAKTVKSLRLLGFMIAARVVASVLTTPAMLLALTYDNPEGHRVLSIATGIPQLTELLYGVLFILIGSVLARAAVIAEEHGQFV